MLLVGACTPDAIDTTPDAGVSLPDVTAVPVDAAPLPDAPPVTVTCADACPDEQHFASCWPAGHYQWSYCLPSYTRCLDATAVCQ